MKTAQGEPRRSLVGCAIASKPSPRRRPGPQAALDRCQRPRPPPGRRVVWFVGNGAAARS